MTLTNSSTIKHTLLRDDRLKPRDVSDGVKVLAANQNGAVHADAAAERLAKPRKRRPVVKCCKGCDAPFGIESPTPAGTMRIAIEAYGSGHCTICARQFGYRGE